MLNEIFPPDWVLSPLARCYPGSPLPLADRRFLWNNQTIVFSLENGQQREKRGGFLQSWFVDYHPSDDDEDILRHHPWLIWREMFLVLQNLQGKHNEVFYNYVWWSVALSGRPGSQPIRGQYCCQLTNHRPGLLWHDEAITPSLQAVIWRRGPCPARSVGGR